MEQICFCITIHFGYFFDCFYVECSIHTNVTHFRTAKWPKCWTGHLQKWFVSCSQYFLPLCSQNVCLCLCLESVYPPMRISFLSNVFSANPISEVLSCQAKLAFIPHNLLLPSLFFCTPGKLRVIVLLIISEIYYFIGPWALQFLHLVLYFAVFEVAEKTLLSSIK